MQSIRVRAIWVLVGLLATTVGVIAWTTIPALPVVGIAATALVMTVNRISKHVRPEACYQCGADTAGQPRGEHGVVCPGCGAIHTPYEGWLAGDSSKHADDSEA
jgi:hypothetical protein